MAGEMATLAQGLRANFRTGRTRPAEWRTAQLKSLVRMIEEKEDDISNALHADLAKPRMESYLHEVRIFPPPSSSNLLLIALNRI
jgi:aldehyde dehydrogenase (NAD+)